MLQIANLVGAKVALAFQLLFVVNTLANVMQAEMKKTLSAAMQRFDTNTDNSIRKKVCYFTVVGFRNCVHGHDLECISQTTQLYVSIWPQC